MIARGIPVSNELIEALSPKSGARLRIDQKMQRTGAESENIKKQHTMSQISARYSQ
jgi:hypothetical protein